VSDVRIILTAKNARVLRAMEKCGFKTVADLCRAMSVAGSQTSVGNLINFKVSPVGARGEWLAVARHVATTLGCEPEDLWPDDLANLSMEKNSHHLDLTVEQARSLACDADPTDRIFAGQLLDKLTPRERQVIEQRFGLRGDNSFDLQEIADGMGVTKERIRQIEIKALNRMRKGSAA